MSGKIKGVNSNISGDPVLWNSAIDHITMCTFGFRAMTYNNLLTMRKCLCF